MHIYPSVWAGVWACGSSQGEISLCRRAWTTDLLCHRLLKRDILLLSFSFLCPCAETLSVCLNEKSEGSQLHTAALRFLCTVLTEETKNRSLKIATSNCKAAAELCDVVRGASAGQLLELLLQVCTRYLNYIDHLALAKVWTPFLSSHQSFEKVSFQDPLKKLGARALMTLLACSPAAQTHAAKGISSKDGSDDPKDKWDVSLISFRCPSWSYREPRGAAEADPLPAQPAVGPTRQSSSSEKGQKKKLDGTSHSCSRRWLFTCFFHHKPDSSMKG